MFKRVLVFVLAMVAAHNLHAQYSISGTVKDQQTQRRLSGASVRLASVTDSLFSRSVLSDSTGRFTFRNLPSDSFRISISFVGYGDAERGVRVNTSNISLDSTGGSNVAIDIALVPGASSSLERIVISTSVAPATQKADTLQLNASQYKVNPDASTEDLVKKMPGITVENGQVKAQGEVVQKVTIDGRELFGDDATAALRNLPAEVVDKIQVFDRLSDQAQFTGFDDGSATKSINIVTKANMRNGQFGRIYAGYGTDQRYAAGGNATLLKNNRRISLVGTFNNINQQNFSEQDLLGVTSNTQRGGGGGGTRGAGGGNRGQGGGLQGGGNTGSFGNRGNFQVGQQNGINQTNAFGINFSDQWGTKLTVTGSYFFNNTENNTNEVANRNYLKTTTPSLSQANTSNSTNNNHRVSMRIEWKLDSANQFIFTPSLGFQNNNSDRFATTNRFLGTQNISETQNRTLSNRSGNNMNNTLLYRHSFPKRGRTFSIGLTTSSNKRTGGTTVEGYQRRFDEFNNYTDSSTNRFTDQFSNGYQLSANINYTEPISQRSQLQVSYNPSYSNSKADQQSFRINPSNGKYTVFDTLLSNRFDNISKAQNAGLSYRYGDRDNQISFGANYQYSTLESDQDFLRAIQVRKSFSNVLPNANVRWKISTRSSVRLFYRSSTNNPSVNQLSDVYDETNLPFITRGNSDLKQQFSNTVNGRYTYTNTAKGIVLVGNIFYQTASDYITNAIYVFNSDSTFMGRRFLGGQQLTMPVNLDGYTSLRTLATFAFPMKFIKSNFNLNGGIIYSKLPGLIDNVQTESRTTTYNAAAVIASNVSQYVDFTVSYSANFSNVETDLKASGITNESYLQQLAGLQLNLLSKNGWFFQNDINNQRYSGLGAGFNQSYTLWNMSVGKKFLKDRKGELKVSVFDLLKQNQSIARNVTETYIEDVQSQVLQQYFMATFTYNLRNFGTAAARRFNRGDGEGNRDRGDFGPPRF